MVRINPPGHPSFICRPEIISDDSKDGIYNPCRVRNSEKLPPPPPPSSVKPFPGVLFQTSCWSARNKWRHFHKFMLSWRIHAAWRPLLNHTISAF